MRRQRTLFFSVSQTMYSSHSFRSLPCRLLRPNLSSGCLSCLSPYSMTYSMTYFCSLSRSSMTSSTSAYSTPLTGDPTRGRNFFYAIFRTKRRQGFAVPMPLSILISEIRPENPFDFPVESLCYNNLPELYLGRPRERLYFFDEK